jgi:signal transduction histidine kinase/ActR/RegA family two-component response regulator
MQKLKFEYRITFAYIILGSIWIVFSDELLVLFVKDSALLTRMQTYKGWFYVIITAILLYSLLKRHLVKIREAEQKAKESDKLKTAFVQNISHEIRTPMNGIIGFVELLNEKNLSETERNEYVEIIRESSNQLLNIVNEVLDISMIETGTVNINKKAVNLNDLLEEIFAAFNPLIKKEISFSLEKGLSDQLSVVYTDDVKIRQVLNNLLNNAFKFTDKGYVNLGYNLKNNELEFFVEDSGIGVESDAHIKIFDRFLKEESENNRLYEGVGLGLAICKGIIDLLNGKIWIKSESGKGSTFFFTIPYEPAKNSEGSKPNRNKAEYKLNGLTILIAEDDDPSYFYLTQVLKETGAELIRAINGKDAIEVIQKNKKISLVLMDIKMPVIDGYEATVQIKRIRPELPIIAQTAFALYDEREKALVAGCSDYISKPYKKELLLEIIAKHQSSGKEYT